MIATRRLTDRLPKRRQAKHASPDNARPRYIARRSALLADPEPEKSIADEIAELEAQDAEQERRDADDPHLTRWWTAVPDGETWPAPAPESYPHAASDPRGEAARVAADAEPPTLADMRRLHAALTAWQPEGRHEAPAPRPAVPHAPPGGATLVSFQPPEKAVVAYLDGMPERTVTDSGWPVLLLGMWPARGGASFAIGDVSDAWLDALLFAAGEEREARRAARVPTFTPHPVAEAHAAPEAVTQVIPNGVPDGAQPVEDVPAAGTPERAA